MRYVFHPEALIEFGEAALYYFIIPKKVPSLDWRSIQKSKIPFAEFSKTQHYLE